MARRFPIHMIGSFRVCGEFEKGIGAERGPRRAALSSLGFNPDY